MSSVAAYDALKNHLVTAFAGTYTVVDEDDVNNALAQGTDPFLALEDGPCQEEGIGLGGPEDHEFTETGGGVVHCFTPAPEASSAVRTISDLVQGALRFTQISAGFRIETVDPGEPEKLNNGLWTTASVAFTFSREFQVDLT